MLFYYPRKPKSIFIELAIPSKSNITIGTVYKHPLMQHYKFNNDFRENPFDDIQTENNFRILSGNFNLNVTYSQITGVNRVIRVILPTRVITTVTLKYLSTIMRINAPPAHNHFYFRSSPIVSFIENLIKNPATYKTLKKPSEIIKMLVKNLLRTILKR